MRKLARAELRLKEESFCVEEKVLSLYFFSKHYALAMIKILFAGKNKLKENSNNHKMPICNAEVNDE